MAQKGDDASKDAPAIGMTQSQFEQGAAQSRLAAEANSRPGQPNDAHGLAKASPDFNYLNMSTVDALANKDGFVSKDSLSSALKGDQLDPVQRDDVKHMLANFDLLSKQVDDKDQGKKGISRDDVAKYNFPVDKNYIDTDSLKKVEHTRDGMVTRDALNGALKRSDLSAVERDDIQYLQHQYLNIKNLVRDKNNDLGISMADIMASNARIPQIESTSYSGSPNWAPLDKK